MTIARATNIAQQSIAISPALTFFLRAITKGSAMTNHAISAIQNSIPVMANNGWMCMRLNPTICGPRAHVQTVFSQAIRTARRIASGEKHNQQTFNQSGKLLRVGAGSKINGKSVRLC